MNSQRQFTMLCYLFITFLLMINGCSKSNLKIDKDKPLPPIIKEYKNITLLGMFSGMKNTGVFIEKDETFTIMATGSIDYCEGGGCGYRHVKPEHGWPIMAKIGKDGYRFSPIFKGRNSNTITRYDSGYLFVGIKDGKVDLEGNAKQPEYYNDNLGSFIIDIIVWKKKDYVQIYAFLERMKDKNPDNDAINDALAYIKTYKNIYLAENEAKKEVDNTKKMLQELKEAKKKKGQVIETVTKGKPSTIDEANQKKVEELENKLAKFIKTLEQLNKTKKQLEKEKQKTAQLSQELEEKEEQKMALINKLEGDSKNPPVLIIASPPDGKKTEGKIIQLFGVAEDNQGVEKLEIFVNGRLLSKEDDRGIRLTGKRFSRRFDFNVRIPLKKGANRIKVRAVNTEGLFSEKIVTVHNIKERRNIWAVVIGINDYKNIRKLKYAVNDAKAFYNLLVSHNKIPAANVTLLINKEAKLTNLRSTLGTKLKKNAGKEDMVIIYFAGHGATERDVMSPDGDGLEKYLLPCDADLKDLYSSALPMREISHIFHRIRSERLIFIADSCYSGASGGRTASFSGIRANISDSFLNRIASGKGTVIITASGANEVSAEKEEFKHGVFTHYLLEGLRGKADIDNNGLITVDEVYRYVSKHVPQATGQEQHPVKKGTVKGRLILSIVQ